MASRFGFGAYKVLLRNKRSRAPWRFKIDSAQDGCAEIERYLECRNKKLFRLGKPDSKTGKYYDNRAVKVTKLEKERGRRLLAGLFYKGEAGRVQQIHDFDEPDKAPVFTTRRNHGMLSPFYFRFHLDDGLPFGVALLLTIGGDGFKTYIEDDLRFFLGDSVDPLTVKMTPFVDAAVLETVAKHGVLQDVYLINSGRTATSRERLTETKVGEDSLGHSGDRLELRIHRKGGFGRSVLDKLVQLVSDGKDPGSIVRVPGVDEIRADNVVVEIKQPDGRSRKLRLTDLEESPVQYDITDTVKLDTNGFPTWKSVHESADDVWQSVRQLVQ